jgi:uncharacterized protein YabN with tetrapyrrole methylase and pyrophosphatase domain
MEVTRSNGNCIKKQSVKSYLDVCEKYNRTTLSQLIDRNYTAVCNRNLITNKTVTYDFIKKLREELQELNYAYEKETSARVDEELFDCLVVVLNMIKFRKLNIEKGLMQIAEKNEARAI